MQRSIDWKNNSNESTRPADEWLASLNATCNRLSTQYLQLLRSSAGAGVTEEGRQDPKGKNTWLIVVCVMEWWSMLGACYLKHTLYSCLTSTLHFSLSHLHTDIPPVCYFFTCVCQLAAAVTCSARTILRRLHWPRTSHNLLCNVNWPRTIYVWPPISC
jgi:hypothetical protein